MRIIRICFLLALALLCLFSLSACTGLRDLYKDAKTSVSASVNATLQPSPISTDVQTHDSPTPTADASDQPTQAQDLLTADKIELSADVNNDGVNETITITNYTSEEVEEETVLLSVVDISGSYKKDVDMGICESAFITTTEQGETCIFINVLFVDYNAAVFSFDGIKPVFRKSVSGLVTDCSGTKITIEDDMDVFGSWYYTRDFLLSDDFTLKPVSDVRITMDGKEPLHTIRKFPVEMLKNGVYVKKTLDKDTYIYPVSTDGESHLIFRLEDGSEGRLTYTFEDYEFYIDGIHEEECFDNIGYWG